MESWWGRCNPLMQMDGAKPLFVPLKEVFHMD